MFWGPYFPLRAACLFSYGLDRFLVFSFLSFFLFFFFFLDPSSHGFINSLDSLPAEVQKKKNNLWLCPVPYRRNYEQELHNFAPPLLGHHRVGSVSVPFKHMHHSVDTSQAPPVSISSWSLVSTAAPSSPQLSPTTSYSVCYTATWCPVEPLHSPRCALRLARRSWGLQAAAAFSQPGHSLISPQRGNN